MLFIVTKIFHFVHHSCHKNALNTTQERVLVDNISISCFVLFAMLISHQQCLPLSNKDVIKLAACMEFFVQLYYSMVNFASLLMMKCASATSQHIDGKLLTRECLEFVFFLTFVLAFIRLGINSHSKQKKACEKGFFAAPLSNQTYCTLHDHCYP